MQLAEAATQGLTPLELYAALLAGPGRWLKGSVPAGTGESLPAKLRQLLVRSPRFRARGGHDAMGGVEHSRPESTTRRP